MRRSEILLAAAITFGLQADEAPNPYLVNCTRGQESGEAVYDIPPWNDQVVRGLSREGKVAKFVVRSTDNEPIIRFFDLDEPPVPTEEGIEANTIAGIRFRLKILEKEKPGVRFEAEAGCSK